MGANVIRVKVTAADNMTTETYTVTVTRAQYACEAPDLAGRHAVWTADMTVGAFSYLTIAASGTTHSTHGQ